MNVSVILTMSAILLAPLVAIQVSVYLEKKREVRGTRLNVFRTLMATRGSKLSVNHINALNMIDVEFYGKDKKLKNVVDAWKLYLNHLKNKGLSDEVWEQRGTELFEDLLDIMATCLDYDFDRVSIKETSYYPEGYGEIDEENRIIRKGLAGVFSGKFGFPVQAISGESDNKLQEIQKRLFELQIIYFSDYHPDKPFRVELVGKD